MDPDQIMNVVITFIVLAVGIFAFFVTVGSMPVTQPVASSTPSVLSGSTVVDNCNTTEYVPTPGMSNNTAVVILNVYNATTADWEVLQAAGAANGTFIWQNDTYRIEPGTVRFSIGGTVHDVTHWNISYTRRDSYTNQIENSSYFAALNASRTGNSVFNIVGVVLIIGAIMTIVGLVYSYVKPGRP